MHLFSESKPSVHITTSELILVMSPNLLDEIELGLVEKSDSKILLQKQLNLNTIKVGLVFTIVHILIE